MSNENAKNFYQKFVTDKELQRQVAEGKQDPKQNFVDVAKAEGFDFTIEEFESTLSNMTVGEFEEMTTSDIVTKGNMCYCYAGGGGTSGKGGGTCACVLGGGGSNDDGSMRCCCIFNGTGN